MKLVELEIRNFGKLNNEKIPLDGGINLISGSNEAGKSTIHTFIRCMLFGMERLRGRASAQDTFHRYTPWENENYYAGSIRFDCDGKLFYLQRNFEKYSAKDVLLCESDGEELSVEDGDLEALLDGLTAASYENTLFIGQLKAPAGKTLADELKNYATGYYVTGGSDIDLAGAIKVLEKKKKDAEKEIRARNMDKQRDRERLEQEGLYIRKELSQMEERERGLEEEIRVEEREAAEKEAAQSAGGQSSVTAMDSNDEVLGNPIFFFLGILAFFAALIWLQEPWKYVAAGMVTLLEIVWLWYLRRESAAVDSEKEEYSIDPALEKEDERQQKETNSRLNKLCWEQEHLEGLLREKQIEYDNINEQIAEVYEIRGDDLEARKKKEAVELAITRLQQLSAGMQSHLSDALNQRASEILSEITGGRYDRLTVNENLELKVCGQGAFSNIRLDQVSRGTQEQIWFALRMAVADLLYREEYPIILDETFAFYDDERLANTLRYLTKIGRQVLLFTCHSREREMLVELGVDFQEICLTMYGSL